MEGIKNQGRALFTVRDGCRGKGGLLDEWGDGCRGGGVGVMGAIQSEGWEWAAFCGGSQWRIYVHVKEGEAMKVKCESRIHITFSE